MIGYIRTENNLTEDKWFFSLLSLSKIYFQRVVSVCHVELAFYISQQISNQLF